MVKKKGAENSCNVSALCNIQGKKIHSPAPGVSMHSYIVSCLHLSFCIRQSYSVATADILTLALFSYCACIWLQNRSHPVLSVFTHISMCSSPIWLQPNHEKLHLNAEGGTEWEAYVDTNFKLSGREDGMFQNMEKDFVVFLLWYFLLQSNNEPINHMILAGIFWPFTVKRASVSQHSHCPFASIFQYFSAVLFLCHASPPHISGSLFYLNPLILPSC